MPYCKNCSKNFDLTLKEKNFYKSLGAKEPTHCFDCRMQRKYAFRNERKLYQRQCDLCQRSIVSMYDQAAPFPVYCLECWWSDRWEAESFAREVDFSRPLFPQLGELQNQVPRMYLAIAGDCVNSPYVSWTDRAKNCYLLYSSSICEDCLYSETLVDCRDCLDCTNLKESENCYFAVDCQKCYNVKFSRNLKNCLDCNFCFDCANCQNCFLSYNLRQAEYCINNIKYSPTAYAEQIQRLMSNRGELAKAWGQFIQLMKSEAIHKFANQVKCDEVEGDELYACQRSYNSFDSREIQDCFNIIYGDKIKDCADSFGIVKHSERCLEVFSSNGSYQNMYGFGNWDLCQNIAYCNSCIACSDCLFCIGLKHKKYCIFNRQYTPEEYKKMADKVLAHMKNSDYPAAAGQTNEWGEFFPMQLSPFAYNETMAAVYYPLPKTEVLSRGWGWREEKILTGQETVAGQDLPETFVEPSIDIAASVVACAACGRNYKMIKREIDFYKKHSLPLPEICPECRFQKRLSLRNPRKLWPRQCSCLLNHDNHSGAAVCPVHFQTTYRPDGGEAKVYCEECYRKEIY